MNKREHHRRRRPAPPSKVNTIHFPSPAILPSIVPLTETWPFTFMSSNILDDVSPRTTAVPFNPESMGPDLPAHVLLCYFLSCPILLVSSSPDVTLFTSIYFRGSYNFECTHKGRAISQVFFKSFIIYMYVLHKIYPKT